MTKLECNVTTCASNANNCCCRPDIQVSGPCACGCEQTCCSSYVEKSRSAAENACRYDQPNQELDICCDAKNCTYNADGKCAADCICVDCCGSQTNTASGTECATFRCR